MTTRISTASSLQFGPPPRLPIKPYHHWGCVMGVAGEPQVDGIARPVGPLSIVSSAVGEFPIYFTGSTSP